MKSVFYSFHFDNDVNRVQLVRNIGALEGNEPVSKNKWEEVKRDGDQSIKNWISSNMAGKSCVVVLIGEQTAFRKWVKYEIEKAWRDGKPLMGIYIHNLKCMNEGTCSKGQNPFAVTVDGKNLQTLIPCYDPASSDAYGEISKKVQGWVESAITNKKN